MNRRTFASLAGMAGAAVVSGSWSPSRTTMAEQFPLHFAPHLGMFRHHAGEDPLRQLEFMADEGFTAFEDNGMPGRTVVLQEQMAKVMMRRNLRMGVFVAHRIYWREPNLASGKEDARKEFLTDIKASVEVAKRVNAQWMTVVPGHLDLRLDIGYQTANVVESLKRACEVLEPHGLVMVLEPLNFRDHPGLFLTKASQAYEVCKAVGSPSCKILYDIYHQQIQEGNLLPNIDRAWDEIAYFQIGDNPGRNEPTTGEINYRNIFKHIAGRGFEGILGMEHGNAQPGKEGERAVINAYKSCSTFE